MLRKLVPGLVIVATLFIGLGVPRTLAQTATNTPPSSVSIAPPTATPPIAVPPAVVNQYPPQVTLRPRPVPTVPPPLPACGTGDFPTLGNTGTARCDPFLLNPHPMLPWGPGQIDNARYGQVIKYWREHPQVVENVILIPLPADEPAKPEEPQGSPQGQPEGQPASPAQNALNVLVTRTPEPRRVSVTVPEAWIVETTRGYIHMPRWVLRELGGGRYEWAMVGAWFQPR